MSPSRARVNASLALLGSVGVLCVAAGRLRESAPRFPVGEAPRVAVTPWLVDLDTAGSDELQVLPGVGPRLAERIVSDRASHGAFGGVQGLDRVRGVGPGLIERIRPHVREPVSAATVPGRGG